MGIREEIYHEGGPHIGDYKCADWLTLIGLPLQLEQLSGHCGYATASLTAGSLTGGCDRTDIIYSEIVKKVPAAQICLRDGNALNYGQFLSSATFMTLMKIAAKISKQVVL